MARRNTTASGLTEQQVAFCREYIVDLNATQAAIRAGYSEHTANEQACRMLKNDRIKEQVQKLMDARVKRVEVKADEVLHELTRLGYADFRELYDEAGCIKPVQEWNEDIARAVASIEVFEEYQGKGAEREFIGITKKIKFWDKPKALELMGKHKKLFTDRVEHSGEVEISSKLAKARKRVKE